MAQSKRKRDISNLAGDLSLDFSACKEISWSNDHLGKLEESQAPLVVKQSQPKELISILPAIPTASIRNPLCCQEIVLFSHSKYFYGPGGELCICPHRLELSLDLWRPSLVSNSFCLSTKRTGLWASLARTWKHKRWTRIRFHTESGEFSNNSQECQIWRNFE